MVDFGRIDIEKFISYSQDLIEVLKNKKDVNNLIQCLGGGKKLRSFCEVEFYEVQKLLEEYQKKIDECKLRIEEVKGQVVNDENLDNLEHELEEELQKQLSLKEELRIVNEQIRDLDLQRNSVDDQKKTLIKRRKDPLKAQKKLSMELSSYASVTNVIPYMDDQTRISGHIVEKDKKVVEKFDFEPTKSSSFEICNHLWDMIDL